MIDRIKRITVIGAGTMGHGIALMFAIHGYEVSLYDKLETQLKKALEKIREELNLLLEEECISAKQAKETMSRIKICTMLKDATKYAEYVIEAIPENLKEKQKLFKLLDELCPNDTILASNTSSLRLKDIIVSLPPNRQKLCMISHLYMPAHLIPIVELSRFGNMDDDAFMAVYEMFINNGKRPVCIYKDITGMIANRLLHALAREAFGLIEDGVGNSEDIENAIKYGICFRSATTGMLEIADIGGLDVWLAGEDNIFPDLNNSAKACNIIRKRVENGQLGIKTGKGFFEYPKGKEDEVKKNFSKRLITQLKASKKY